MLRFGVSGATRLKSGCLPRKEAGGQGWRWRGYGGTQLAAEPPGDAARAVGRGRSEGWPGCKIGSPHAARPGENGFSWNITAEYLSPLTNLLSFICIGEPWMLVQATVLTLGCLSKPLRHIQ